MEKINLYHKQIGLGIYLLICVFDFLVYPVWLGLNRPDYFEFIKAVSELPIEVQREAIALAYREFTPFTLKGGALFHLSVGAIFTGAELNERFSKKG